MAATKGIRKVVLNPAALLAVTAFFTGCITHSQAYVVDVDAREWQTPAVVTLPNSDTVTLHDMRLFLRSNDQLSADTIPVRITVLAPDSVYYEEKFLLVPSYPQIPTALGRETDVSYRRRVRLNRTGDYRITISPDIPVQGVEAIGIHLVKSQ